MECLEISGGTSIIARLTIRMMNLLMPGETERVASLLLSRAGRGCILEIGGGVSRKTTSMARESKVVNTDISFKATSQVPWRKGGWEEKVAASAVHLPYRARCFDAATLFEVLEHIEEDYRAANEVERSVKNLGLLYITSPSDKWKFPHLKYPLQRYLFPKERDLDFGHARRGYSVEQICSLFPGSALVRGGYYMSFLGGLFYDLRFSRLGRIMLAIFPVLVLLKFIYHFSTNCEPGFRTCVYAILRKANMAS